MKALKLHVIDPVREKQIMDPMEEPEAAKKIDWRAHGVTWTTEPFTDPISKHTFEKGAVVTGCQCAPWERHPFRDYPECLRAIPESFA